MKQKTITDKELKDIMKIYQSAFDDGDITKQTYKAAMLAYEVLLGDFYSECARELNKVNINK